MEKLRILIVEDQKPKFLDVSKKIRHRFKAEKLGSPLLTHVDNYTDAAQLVAAEQFDLIILDLKIPFVQGEAEYFEASSALVSYLLKAKANRPFRIIALTAHSPEEYGTLGTEDPSVVVEHYSAADQGWLDRIVLEIRYLSSAKTALVKYFSKSYDLDVLFIVARHDNEFVPVSKSIEWIGDATSDARLSERKNLFGRIKISRGRVFNAGLVCVQEAGLSTSAALTAYLVSIYRPRFVFMLGMCCGLRDDRSPSKSLLGDVVVAKETACWDEGKYSEELSSSDPFYVKSSTRMPDGIFRTKIPGLIETHKAPLQEAVWERTKKFDLDDIEARCGEPINRKPEVHFGLMVSGSSVVDHAGQVDIIRERFPAAIALEMEAHSIYAAMDATVGLKPSALVIKGVADHGQGKKNNAAQAWASASSYALALKLLELVG